MVEEVPSHPPGLYNGINGSQTEDTITLTGSTILNSVAPIESEAKLGEPTPLIPTANSMISLDMRSIESQCSDTIDPVAWRRLKRGLRLLTTRVKVGKTRAMGYLDPRKLREDGRFRPTKNFDRAKEEFGLSEANDGTAKPQVNPLRTLSSPPEIPKTNDDDPSDISATGGPSSTSLVASPEVDEGREDTEFSPLTPPCPRGSPDYIHSAQSITADRALAHASGAEMGIRDTLIRFRYQGSYLICAGFNEEMVHLGRYVEEIYIALDSDVLESNVSTDLGDALEVILSPFPGILFTPKQILFVPTSALPLESGSGELWEYLKDRPRRYPDGHCVSANKTPLPVLNDTTYLQTGGDGAGGDSGQGGSEQEDGGHEGHCNDGGNGGRGSGSNDDNDDGDKSSGGAAKGSGEGNDKEGDKSKDTSVRFIKIPFSSTLISKRSEDPSHRPVKFTTSSCVDITVDENHGARSFPPGLKWPGPWFEVDMTSLDVTTDGGHVDTSGYALGLCQVRTTASSCPTSIIKYSPNITHLEEDTIKTKTEKNNTGGGWVTLGANPTARLGGSIGRTSGVEKTQRRWEIMTHRLNLDRNYGNRTGNPQKAMLWKYAHNDNIYERVVGHSFESRPSAVFGYSQPSSHHSMPQLEVEVVTYWSSTFRANLRQFFAFRGTASGPPPAFTNFLHHVSIMVDLGRVNSSSSWVIDADALDEQTASGSLDGPILFQPITRFAQTPTGGGGTPACEISIRRAIEGKIVALTQEERTGAVSLLPFTSPDQTPFRTSLPLGAQSSSGQLPIPSQNSGTGEGHSFNTSEDGPPATPPVSSVLRLPPPFLDSERSTPETASDPPPETKNAQEPTSCTPQPSIIIEGGVAIVAPTPSPPGSISSLSESESEGSNRNEPALHSPYTEPMTTEGVAPPAPPGPSSRSPSSAALNQQGLSSLVTSNPTQELADNQKRTPPTTSPNSPVDFPTYLRLRPASPSPLSLETSPAVARRVRTHQNVITSTPKTTHGVINFRSIIARFLPAQERPTINAERRGKVVRGGERVEKRPGVSPYTPLAKNRRRPGDPSKHYVALPLTADKKEQHKRRRTPETSTVAPAVVAGVTTMTMETTSAGQVQRRNFWRRNPTSESDRGGSLRNPNSPRFVFWRGWGMGTTRGEVVDAP